jgi:hypothetical protein
VYGVLPDTGERMREAGISIRIQDDLRLSVIGETLDSAEREGEEER